MSTRQWSPKNDWSGRRAAAILSALLIVVTILVSTLRADRDLSCKLKSGGQADYHCPVNFHAVVAGDNTDRCDGSCYANGDAGGLTAALRDIIVRRFKVESTAPLLARWGQQLQQQGLVRIPAGDLPAGRVSSEDLIVRTR